MVKSPGISLPRAPIPSALRLELRRKIDRHQNVTGVSSTCQCEELPMFRGRRRAPAGSRIGAQSEAPSGSDSYCANRRPESTNFVLKWVKGERLFWVSTL